MNNEPDLYICCEETENLHYLNKCTVSFYNAMKVVYVIII